MPCTWPLLLLILLLTSAGCVDPIGSGADDGSGWPWASSTEAPIVVPRGTTLHASLVHPLSSASSRAGQPFVATISTDLRVYGEMAIPEGSTLHGVVSEVWPATPSGTDALLALEFRTIELPDGSSADIRASLLRTAGARRARDASGSILPAMSGARSKPTGRVVGNVVGSVVGTGIVMAPDGEQVSLPAGTRLKLRLVESLDLQSGH